MFSKYVLVLFILPQNTGLRPHAVKLSMQHVRELAKTLIGAASLVKTVNVCLHGRNQYLNIAGHLITTKHKEYRKCVKVKIYFRL